MNKKVQTFNQNGQEKVVKDIKLNTIAISLVESGDNEFAFTFQKSLSNIKSLSELLPLAVDQPGFANTRYTIDGDQISLFFTIEKYSRPFSDFKKSLLHEKLDVLKNVSYITSSQAKGYTHILHPDNVYVDDSDIPYVLYRGYVDVLEPLTQTKDDLVRQYQALVFSLLDNKYDFEALYAGALEIAKKTPFLEKVYNATSISEIEEIVTVSYHEEVNRYNRRNKAYPKSQFRTFQLVAIFATIFALLVSVPLVYAYFVQIPYMEKMNKASSYFAAQKYGDVATTLAKETPESLPHAQKYMAARSVIETQTWVPDPKSKQSALQQLQYDASDQLMEFWIYLGRENYTKAYDISLALKDDALIYTAASAALTIIDHSKSMDGQTKEAEYKKYHDIAEAQRIKMFGLKLDGTPVDKDGQPLNK